MTDKNAKAISVDKRGNPVKNAADADLVEIESMENGHRIHTLMIPQRADGHYSDETMGFDAPEQS